MSRRRRTKLSDLFGHWAVIVGLTFIIGLTCIALWRFHAIRPFLAGAGAGLAAFLAPLPGFLTPDTRGKWFIAIFLASLIGVGTWYSTDAIEQERRQLDRRLRVHQDVLTRSAVLLQGDERSTFILNTAGRLKELYGTHDFDSILDITDVLAGLDKNNGHVLYYRGEAYRSLQRGTDMRGSFQKYLQEAAHHTCRFSEGWDPSFSKPFPPDLSPHLSASVACPNELPGV